ncbi:MAG TPA: tetratricopeptide repeat protein [Candidatus Binataceae bacterium]|nr:tetratricopeptide repeat protein [Candidatus Binataceae bacterium]
MASAAIAMSLFVAGCRGKSVEDYLAAGDDALKQNQMATAEQDYAAAVKAAPNDPRTHLALGNLYTVEHNRDAAKQELMRAVELDPRNTQGHLALGRYYLAQNQFPMAEEQYLAAAALEPASTEPRIELAQVYQREGKLDLAERELRTAIGLAPKDGKPHFALANLLSQQGGREAEADTEYARAQALDPTLVRAVVSSSVATPAPIVNLPPNAVPVASPTPGAAPGTYKIKAVNKKFELTHDSPVYQAPDSTSAVLSKVHRRRWVRVIGISGDWLQIKLRNGTVGFIPMSAAE